MKLFNKATQHTGTISTKEMNLAFQYAYLCGVSFGSDSLIFDLLSKNTGANPDSQEILKTLIENAGITADSWKIIRTMKYSRSINSLLVFMIDDYFNFN